MIQWRYLIPRVVILVALVVGVHLALSPIAQYWTVRSIERNTGATLQLGSAKVGLFPPTVQYRDVKLTKADNATGETNTITAESIALELDADALLHRRYVVRDGRIEGVTFQTKVSPEDHVSSSSDTAISDESVWLSQIFEAIQRASQAEVDAFGQDLELVKQADQIRRKWKSEYALLSKRAETLEASIKAIPTAPSGPENPLRDRPQVEANLAKSKTAQAELVAVRTAMDEIPAKVQADLISLQNAKQADLDRIQQIAPANLLSAEDVAPRLLAGLVNRQVDRMRTYVDCGRDLAAWKWEATTPTERGTSLALEPGYRAPGLLIERCEVRGTLAAAASPFQVTGVIENVTNEPWLRPSPFRARLKLEGPQTVRVDYTRDDSSTVLRETLTMHWPEVIAPTTQLGDVSSLAVQVQDGKMEVWAEISTIGDQLQGRLVSRRLGSKIAVTGGADAALVSSLNQSLSALDRVEIDAAFTGTWSDMNVSINTNLSHALKGGLDHAMTAQAMATRAAAVAKLNQVYQAQVVELQTLMSAEQKQARELLARADSTIQAFSTKVMQDSGAADAYLGRLRGGSVR